MNTNAEMRFERCNGWSVQVQDNAVIDNSKVGDLIDGLSLDENCDESIMDIVISKDNMLVIGVEGYDPDLYMCHYSINLS